MTTADPFKGYTLNPYGVFDNVIEVTPSDIIDLPVIATTLAISATGAFGEENNTKAVIRVTTAGGQEMILEVISGLLWLPVRVRKVWATDTSANRILALW